MQQNGQLSTIGDVKVKAASTFGAGKVIFINYKCLEFDFAGAGLKVDKVTFDFKDGGTGWENIYINGAVALQGDIKNASFPIQKGGANISFTPSPGITNQSAGTITILPDPTIIPDPDIVSSISPIYLTFNPFSPKLLKPLRQFNNIGHHFKSRIIPSPARQEIMCMKIKWFI